MPLILRDVPAWGVYFYAYDLFKDLLSIDTSNGFKDATSVVVLMMAGGASGVASWLISYPFDIVKTQIQCTEGPNPGMERTMASIIAKEGIHGFTKGLAPTLLRTFIVNALTLPAFDYLINKHCKAD